MSPRPEPPPQHVCAAFGARGVQPELVDGGPAWVCGEVVLKPVTNPAEAAWIAQTLDTLKLPDLRLARPLRSTDGRWVVAGWSATRLLEGRPEPRHDEVVAVSLRLHAATAGLPRPRFVDARRDVFSLADRVAWGEEDQPLAMDRGGRLFEMLAALRRPIGLDPQVVHGDLFGNVLFHGDGPPAVIDFTPYWRPAEWAAAVVVVDSLAWGGADPGLVERWASLSYWPQVLLRALLFRLAVNAMHPRATPESLEGLQRTYHVVHPLL